jgi:MarR family transcriptional regulator, 2-MHQ and catechol-resistance regulon repressor
MEQLEGRPDEISAARLWLVLARAHGSLVSYIEGALDALGLGLSDFMVLEVLLHKGPLTISAIGQKVLLASASMTSAIDRLEKRGLVARKTCNSDRRIRFVDLTEEGKLFITKVFSQHKQDLEFVTAALSPEERQVVYDGLKKIGLAAKNAPPRST